MLLVISNGRACRLSGLVLVRLLFSLLLAALTPPVPLSSRSLLARFTSPSLSLSLSLSRIVKGKKEKEPRSSPWNTSTSHS